MSFSSRGLECQSRKSRDTCSNGQTWPWSTKWSRAKGNRVLPRESTGHSKHPLPTTQYKTLHMDITRWSTPKADWLYYLQPKMEKLYTVSKNKTGSWLAQIMNSVLPNSDLLKKVRKTTRPFSSVQSISRVLFFAKSRKSRNTWSNRQIWPWSTEWNRAKANSFAKRTHWS